MTYMAPRNTRLGYCNDQGIGITEKVYTFEEALRTVQVQNERARQAAERGVFPNTVYWIYENHDQKERKIGT